MQLCYYYVRGSSDDSINIFIPVYVFEISHSISQIKETFFSYKKKKIPLYFLSITTLNVNFLSTIIYNILKSSPTNSHALLITINSHLSHNL